MHMNDFTLSWLSLMTKNAPTTTCHRFIAEKSTVLIRMSLMLLFLLCTGVVCAQQVEVTLTEAGTLSEKIASDQKYSITSLKVSGPINGTDVRYLREMAGRDYQGDNTIGRLVDLDLVDAEIVEGGDYYYCKHSLNYYYTKDGTIENRMFYQSKLETIKLPKSATNIESSAFSGCSSLTSVSIPNTVTSIGSYAFCNCLSLTSVVIPNSMTSIESSTFYGCSSLTSVSIPGSVTNIGESAFYGCSSLKTLSIEDGETQLILSNASLPSSIEKLYLGRNLSGTSPNFGKNSLEEVTIGSNVTSVRPCLFSGYSSLTSVIIPNSVTNIGYSAFSGCSNLLSITLPTSVTSIADNVFDGCSSLTSVIISNSVTNIGYSAFRNCSSLTSITIPSSVVSIDGYSFSDCYALTSVTIPKSVTSIGNFAFSGCSGLKTLSIEDCDTELKLGNGSSLPSSVMKLYIGRNLTGASPCFGESLTDVTIGSMVTSIANLFYGCSSLTSVTIPNSVTSIGNYAFDGCSSLTSITIPNSVTNIGKSAFAKCSSLPSVIIPNTVTSLGDDAFSGCFNLNNS